MAGVGPRADVLVVGGGALGLVSALELAAAGRGVCLVDAGDFTQGTSHGNAGLLCPSYVTPIASPQILLTALGWLARGEGPFSLARPPWQPPMAAWLARFVAACAAGSRGESTKLLAGLARRSIEWYGAFACSAPAFGFVRNGWLYVYGTERGFDEGVRHARSMRSLGVESQRLSAEDALEVEPTLRPPAGAIRYSGDAYLDPHAFVAAAVERARAAAIALEGGVRVRSIVPRAGDVVVQTDRGDIVASEVVVAAGAATPELTRALGAGLPILPARGHSAWLETTRRPRIALLFAEAHLVLTPMSGRLRMTSGLELGSWDTSPDAARVAHMAEGARAFFAESVEGSSEPWVGFRPLTPDGLPIVGRLARARRVIVASGHGTLGMTLAPATGELVRAIVEGEPEPPLVSPKRFGS
ncbi:MAG: NAD(P)/FAD-dependent oxidoreductase [Betaproteobacteria bacterium]